MDTTTTSNRAPVATAIAALAGVGALGAAIMAVAHLGITVPGFPGPGRMLLPVAIGFMVGTGLFALVALGVLRGASWAWPVALAVNGLAFVSAVYPVRGAFSFVAGAVTLAAVILLLSPAGRRALR